MHQSQTSFNISDVLIVLQKKKNFIISFVTVATLIATALVFFVLPKYYTSTAIVVAANPALADKSRLFNENIEGLYSAYGSEDDLNRIYGLALLDTTYKLLVAEFDLVKYYKTEGEGIDVNQRKAINALKENVQLIKTDLYQLKISATTKSKNLSARIANRMVEILESMAQDVYRNAYHAGLENLQKSTAQLEAQLKTKADSLPANQLEQLKMQAVIQQIQLNEKLANQYRVALTNTSPAIIVLEKAYTSAKADKPDKFLIIASAFFSALAFSIILVIFLERR